MQKPSFDPGLTQQATGTLRRAINKDGSFDVERRGGSWRDIHPYLHLINMSWASFLGTFFLTYVAVNFIFALLYFSLGTGEIQGVDSRHGFGQFLNAFFFSAQTLTTVGYGNFAPTGIAANVLAALEAMVGLMGFALATGLLFGRVSKPSAKIAFSERARKFQNLSLERERVNFFPLTWTVVHPIDEASPLHGKTPAELEELQAEVLILIKGFDDTFSQSVNARYSYRYDEMEWGARFSPAFYINEAGQIVLNVDEVGKFARVESAQA
jgi:inward rectifier potassium channel